MTRQGVLIRGNNDGITVFLSENVEFSTILEELRDKFTNSNGFFKSASITINSGNRQVSPEEKMALINLCQEFELAGIEFVNTPMVTSPRGQKKQSSEEGETLILKKTIRSGQRVSYRGNVVVIGDVNPGAEIVAAGDIVVLGHLRGVVHAGAMGNTEAEVYALSLQPTQLRIAHCIARSPDGNQPKRRGKIEPEKAKIKEGMIVIDDVEE